MPTLAQLETVLVDILDQILIAVRVVPSPATDTTPRAYLGPQIAEALREQHVAVADPRQPTNDEVLLAKDYDRLKDISELLLLIKYQRKFIQVDWSTNVQKQWLDQFRQGLATQVADKRDYCMKTYGYGLGTVGAMTLDLDFSAHRRWSSEGAG